MLDTPYDAQESQLQLKKKKLLKMSLILELRNYALEGYCGACLSSQNSGEEANGALGVDTRTV